MSMRERAVWCVLTLVLLGALLSRRRAPETAALERPRAQPGIRLSMAMLHQQGGVPLGWQLTLPPGIEAAGRQTFVDLGCPACHAVNGESSSQSVGSGPDLGGMGSHHPAGYFAEAILNPDAVLIDAPGWVGADGRSAMPAYPDMTVTQLSDLVAYLASLKQPGANQSCHGGTSAPTAAVVMSTLDLHDRPAPPRGEARAFFAQSYDALPGMLPAFETWFATRGRQRLLAVDGLVGVDTFVDPARAGSALTTVFGFRTEAALRNFLGDPATADLWKEFDGYIGPHGHYALDRPLVYRAPTLSTD